MEDAHVAVVDMENHKGWALFAVFDGHDGSETSVFCAENIYKKLDSCKEFTSEEIIEKFLELDEDLGNRNSGSTCSLVLVDTNTVTDKGTRIIVANLGDSRSLVGRYDSGDVRALTTDHKPELPSEASRIEAAGGVVYRNRVDSSLAVSRAFGDKPYKANAKLAKDKQKVICVPEVTESHIAKNEFLYICCDGIFETYTNETAIQFCTSLMKDTQDTAAVLSNLLTSTLKGGSRDNMTAMLIELADGTDFAAPEEFVPGKLYAYGNETFFAAYRLDCEQHGLKWEEIEKGLPRSDEGEALDLRQLSSLSQPSLLSPNKNPIALTQKSTRTTQSSRNLMGKPPSEVVHKVEDSKEEDNEKEKEKAEKGEKGEQHEVVGKRKKGTRSTGGREKKGIIAKVTSITGKKK